MVMQTLLFFSLPVNALKLPHSCELTHTHTQNLSVLLMTYPLLILINTPGFVQTSGRVLVTTERPHAFICTQLPHYHRHPHSTGIKEMEGKMQKNVCFKYNMPPV